MLTLDKIKLRLNNRVLFSNISFSILPGAIYILTGKNGSGKTSLLKIISQINNDFEGNLLWNNQIIDKALYHKYIVSYSGHETAIKDDLTLIENLYLWAKIKNTELLLPGALNQFNLEEFVHLKGKQLSAGIKKRAALARIILSDCDLWLLDEPETNLDKDGIELLLKLLQAKINAGGMVIIASHNLEHYKKIPIINIEDFHYDS